MFSQSGTPSSSGSAFDMRRLMNKQPAPERGTVLLPYSHSGRGLVGVATCRRCGADFQKPLGRDPAWCPHCGAIQG